MSPWEFAIGQVVGYKPYGPKWRGKVTVLERDGKPVFAIIPTIDQEGHPIRYDKPPSTAMPIVDVQNYFLVEATVQMTDPWLAARLDHEDIRPPEILPPQEGQDD